MAKFEYAPAPESRSVVSLRESYGLFIGGEFVAGADGGVFKTISPATEEVLAEVAEAGPADVDRAVAAARQAYEQTWSVMPGTERAKYLFRIARIIAERARELAVLESLDNGKPIRESRDVDIPLVAAHFFYHAGWADKLEYAGFGPAPRPLGVAGQVIPWNFPLLMLAWKIAPALACGNTVVLKPAETTPLTALALRGDLPAGRPAAGCGQHRHRGGRDRPGAGQPSRHQQGRLHRLDRGRQGDRPGRACAGTRPRKKLTLELGGKAANIVFEDAPVDQAVEGIVNGIFFNQGHVCCAGSRLLVQESVQDEVLAPLRRRLATLRVGDPLDKNTDVGAINSAAQLAKIRELSEVGEAEGAERWSPPCELPDRGFWFPPTVFTGVVPGPSHRAGGDLRAGAVGADLPHAGRGDREGQQHPVRPVGRGLDRQGFADPVDGRPAAGRRGLGQHLQQVRPGLAVRRLQGVRLRPRRRPARPGGVSGCLDAADPPGCTQDLQAVHRRRLPAQRVRQVLPGDRPQGQVPGQRRAGLAQGRAGRGRRRRARHSPAGPVPPLTTAARCSTAWPS